MVNKERELKRRRPQVEEVHEFLEITRDFTDPREAIREAISNSIDWGASEIKIIIKEDDKRPDEELIIEIFDNGIGLDEERLRAFFDLGRTTPTVFDDSGKPVLKKIGYKGHGTKTYFNSRQIEVESDSLRYTVYAIMDSPLQKLMSEEVPEYEYDIEEKNNEETYTKITIYGYNMNQNKRDFAHNILKDYILWFTRFGSVEKEFGILDNQDKILLLQGLGREDDPERIEFGHRFPEENCDIKRLLEERPSDWTKLFVKRWYFQKKAIIDYPGKFIDMVFYIEGDEAKRSYNPMIRVQRKTPEYGMYKVEDRYGLWVCKDYIPIKRYNEWLGLGKRLETKYHAFVNCQEFRLTANRGDIGNTPPDLLNAIERTVRQIFEDEIIGSPEYQEYEEAAELEQQYQTAEQEKKDFSRRCKRAKTKKVCKFKDIDLIEPSVEMGVVSLFNLIYALEPSLFPFHIIDYDTKRGYDALVSHRTPFDLSKESMSFIEFKYMLTPEFNHSFEHLIAIICWDCNLPEGTEVRDIKDKRRELRIIPTEDKSEYTRYKLISLRERHNIDVFVLKEYLREKLKIEFRPRSKRS
jgi:hypothetical protein